MATQIEQKPPVEGLPPSTEGSAPVIPPAYPPPSYPPLYPPLYPPDPTYQTYQAPPPVAREPQREPRSEQQRWIGWCFWLAVVSFGIFIPLLGIAQGVASQYAVGFGGFLAIAAIPAALLAIVNMAFMIVTRPRP